MPKGLTEWGLFILAVGIAGIVINTATNFFPALDRISRGLTPSGTQ